MLARTGEMPEGAPELQKLQVLSGVSEYPSRVKCATLPWSALIAALDARREVSHD
jgi:nitrogen fixation NifU-like protein